MKTVTVYERGDYVEYDLFETGTPPGAPPLFIILGRVVRDQSDGCVVVDFTYDPDAQEKLESADPDAPEGFWANTDNLTSFEVFDADENLRPRSYIYRDVAYAIIRDLVAVGTAQELIISLEAAKVLK